MEKLNKNTIQKAYKILKLQTNLQEQDIENILNLFYQLACVLVEQEWDLILEEIETKY